MKKAILFFLLSAIFVSLFACTAAPSENKVKLENLEFVSENLSQSPTKTLKTGDSSFRIWSEALASASDVTEILDRIEGKGYRNIALYLLWSDFEYEQGKYSFSFIDELIPLITGRGYKIDLTLVLWTYGLSWKDQLDFQITRTGDPYLYDEARGETISICSQSNITCVKNAVYALAEHCEKTFGEDIVQWGAVFSDFGKAELSSLAGIDCSDAAREAFTEYLKDKYTDIETFNSHISRTYESWDAISQTEFSTLADLAAFDHEIFTQEALGNFLKNITVSFKTAAQGTPISLKITDPTSLFSARTMGVSDLYSLALNAGVDSISFVASSNAIETAFICDMIHSVTGLSVIAELDSASLTEEAEAENARWLSGRATFAETANFDGDSPQPSTFSAGVRDNMRSKEIILINTLDYLLQPPTEGLYRKLRAAYTGMSIDGEGTVTIYSDKQIIENPELLTGIEEIHLGALSNTVYMYPALAEILASYPGRISDNDNAQPTYIDQYGNGINEDYVTAINGKIANS